MKVVIVGGAVAGTAAAVRLRHLDEQADIIRIEKGPDIAVARCGIPYCVGEVVEQMCIRDRSDTVRKFIEEKYPDGSVVTVF